VSQRWYWAVEVDLDARRVRLDPEETSHLLKVIRHRTGDAIEAIDGRGGRYTVALLPRGTTGKSGRDRGLEAEILAVHPPVPEPTPLVLCAPLIPWPRLEALLDGAVQLGVTDFCAWEAERASLRGAWSELRIARLQRIARAATSQSLGSHAPRVAAPRPLPDILATWAGCAIWVAHGPVSSGSTSVEPAGGATLAPPGRVLVIGPEGGLTDREVGLCFEAGARCLSLGSRRLRTEVAAIAGLAALQVEELGWYR
jgi:16S rRNA (uracil1498-N3)-methyltransferase